MAKLTDEQKKKIVADYINTQNACETARMNNVNESTVRRIIKDEDYQDIARKSEEKKQENTQSTLDYMQEQHDTKKRILEKILSAIEKKSENIDMFTNIKDLATAYGIILDKELKWIELQKNKVNDEKTKIVIVNSLPRDDNDEPNN